VSTLPPPTTTNTTTRGRKGLLWRCLKEEVEKTMRGELLHPPPSDSSCTLKKVTTKNELLTRAKTQDERLRETQEMMRWWWWWWRVASRKFSRSMQLPKSWNRLSVKLFHALSAEASVDVHKEHFPSQLTNHNRTNSTK